MRFEVSTKIRVLTAQEAVFPTITICNYNPFTTQYADEIFSAANITNNPMNIWLLDEHTKKTTGAYLSQAQKERMDQSVRLWDINRGECIRVLSEPAGCVFSLERVSVDLLASVASQCKIKLWNVTSGECVLTLDGQAPGDLKYGLKHLKPGGNH